MIEAWDIVIWKDVMSEKQYVSRVLEAYKCESSYDGEFLNRYCYKVVDVVDYLCESRFIYDYNIEEVYKKAKEGA